jgi:type II secretory pathway pseudopilin PulG
MKIKNLKNKKGFSLVELLVSFAIFGVICVAIVGFISMSSRSYRRTSALINLQIEYQVTMNMLNEYIIGCNAGIAFNPNTNTLYIVNKDEDDNFSTETFNFVNTGDNRGLFLNGIVDMISKNITEFLVTENNNIVSVTMTFHPLALSRGYSATQMTALRNTPVWADSYEELIQVLALT